MSLTFLCFRDRVSPIWGASQVYSQQRGHRTPSSDRYPPRTLASGVTLHGSIVHRDRTLLTGYHVRAGPGSHLYVTIGGMQAQNNAQGVWPLRPVRKDEVREVPGGFSFAHSTSSSAPPSACALATLSYWSFARARQLLLSRQAVLASTPSHTHENRAHHHTIISSALQLWTAIATYIELDIDHPLGINASILFTSRKRGSRYQALRSSGSISSVDVGRAP
ncbi:hypothetical protein QBC40DRAFT_81785 [Triangularia verruculosa]|uniref:Uncharacterized protein n=1 Tax=Triangularia verruculosa TaxID=2587418 RepID=A0AAN6XET7_9PEZI|nr:hypothetical protein QBC40DRAFT_81785 [Triangularia verruculosa]